MKTPTAVPSNRLHYRLLQLLRPLIWLIFFSLAQPFAALAQTNAPAPLSAAAQEAVNKGIIAAKVPDYLLAIRYFEEARKLAPQAPVIYLNLGLAESKIAGRELRAIAWFGAYLAAYPDAPNVAAVKEQIAVLDVRNQSNVSRLLKSAEGAAMQIPAGSFWRALSLVDVAKLWARTGDIAAAEQVVALIKAQDSSGVSTEAALANISSVQAFNGDVPGARRRADSIQDSTYKIKALIAIASAQREAKDITGARATLMAAYTAALDSKDSDSSRTHALLDIVKGQAAAGDVAGAQKTMSHVLFRKDNSGINRLFNENVDREIGGIVQAQAKAGDIQGALATADTMQTSSVEWARGTIVTAQLAAGDVTGALKTTALLPEGLGKSQRQYPIGEAQIAAGDLAGALRTAAVISVLSYQGWLLEKIHAAQIASRDLAGALRTAALFPEGWGRTYARLKVLYAQIESGDLAGAPATADLLVGRSRVSGLTSLANAQAAGGNRAGAELSVASARQSVDLIVDAKEKADAQKWIADAEARIAAPAAPKPSVAVPPAAAPPPAPNAKIVHAWLRKLDDVTELKHGAFLDLAGYLKALPPSDDPKKVFSDLYWAIERLIGEQSKVEAMLKEQAKR